MISDLLATAEQLCRRLTAWESPAHIREAEINRRLSVLEGIIVSFRAMGLETGAVRLVFKRTADELGRLLGGVRKPREGR